MFAWLRGATTKAKELTPEQQDVKYLGDRMPFGDRELLRLSRCHATVETSPDRASFLSDFAVHALGTDATPDQREERVLLVQVLEAKILPEGFGNQLYKTAFLKKGEASIYDSNNNQTTGDTSVEDDYIRLSRLEQFFDGLSNCGRRGTKQAVKVLVECCVQVEDDNNANNEALIRAEDLIKLAYRIALAATFLVASSKSQDEVEEEDNDMMRFLPATDKASQQELYSFAKSIVEHATTQRTRMGAPPLSKKAQDELWVTQEDVAAWVDDGAPLFAATLSTFIFQIFCPGQAYPPSRTPFIYPVIPTESAFFEASSSTILFVLACLSPALSGPVSIFLSLTCLDEFLNVVYVRFVHHN